MQASALCYWVRAGLGALVMCSLVRAGRADAIDDYVKSEMARLHIPEIAFAVVKNGQVVRSDALGFSDVAAKREAKIDDLFEIGSLTKQFTAMGVLMLVESGRIGLDDPVVKYLPDAPAAWAPITVRNLLNQDSGLQEYVFVKGLGLVDKFTRAEFMTGVGKLPLDFQPGQAWAYSNTNYALLGWILEQAAGEPYTKFIEENILRPAGMNHTVFGQPGEAPPGLAKGYLLRRTGAMPSPRGAASIKSDGALISNIGDMLKWDEALAALRLVTRNSYGLMWSRVRLNSGRVRPYGMGFYLSMPGGVAYLGHGGNSAGYSCGFSRFPVRKLTVILLSNVYPLPGEQMTKHIAALFDPTLVGPEFQAATDPDSKRTDRVKLALTALAENRADDDLLEPEQAIPMKSRRGRRGGPGAWFALRKIETMVFGSAKPQGTDTILTYRVTAGPRNFVVVVLWSKDGKLAQASLYPESAPEISPPAPAKER